MTIYSDYILNMQPGSVMETVRISQGEALWRILRFRLYNGGSVFTIPAGTNAYLNGRKPDGTGFSYAMTVEQDPPRVSIPVKQQMSAVAGAVVCEVMVENNDEVIGSVNFRMMVEPSPLDTATMSDSDMHAVLEAVALIGQAVHSAEMAEYYAEQAEHTVTGVIDFNNRAGHVSPAAHDYTAAMIDYGSDTVDDTLDLILDDMNLWYKQGEAIASGSPLTYGPLVANPGKYYASNATIAQSLLNCPTSVGFMMYTIQQTSASARVLLLVDASGQIYIDRVTNIGTNFDATSGTGWKRLVNSDDLDDLNADIAVIATKADIASPTFTGVPKAPTPDGTVNSALANVSFVTSKIGAIPNASTSQKGLMTANDKTYVDQMRVRVFDLYESCEGITVGNQTRCWVYLRRGNTCMVTAALHITVGASDIAANSHVMQALPDSIAIHARVVLSTNTGDSTVNAYIDDYGYLVNSAKLLAGKTYYGNVTYACGDASNWYDLLG